MRNSAKARIHQIVENSIRKVLRENETSIKESYYQLIDAINKFEEMFENEYDTTDGANQEVMSALEAAREKVNDFVRHPEGSGSTKMWDNVGL